MHRHDFLQIGVLCLARLPHKTHWVGCGWICILHGMYRWISPMYANLFKAMSANESNLKQTKPKRGCASNDLIREISSYSAPTVSAITESIFKLCRPRNEPSLKENKTSGMTTIVVELQHIHSIEPWATSSPNPVIPDKTNRESKY